MLVAGAGLQPLDGSGPLLHLTGKITEEWGQTEIVFKRFYVNEGRPYLNAGDDVVTISVPGLTVSPKVVARGMGPITLEVVDYCCDLDGIEWYGPQMGGFLGEGPGLTLDPPTLVTTGIQVALFERQLVEPVMASARILVAEEDSYFDLDGNGCNELGDLLLLLESWQNNHLPGNCTRDANGDGATNILDLFYIDLGGATPCTPN